MREKTQYKFISKNALLKSYKIYKSYKCSKIHEQNCSYNNWFNWRNRGSALGVCIWNVFTTISNRNIRKNSTIIDL